MAEDQYYTSYLDEQTSNSTVNTGCDFNKYDPYVEKIRTLFVPSLEHRIYSCLETFVYSEDQDALSEPPYLKRCLDLAATWREPVYAFSTKLGDPGFVEKTLTQAVNYLIKDGLIDCFLNAIILNNRLNKVCRKLDAAGIEKDFLRYLAVWNYINEKDYWIETDTTVSTSMLSSSYDSIGNNSDLEVQVGSGLDSERTRRCYRQASKRHAVDLSELVCNNAPENCCRPQCCSRLNVNSKNSEGYILCQLRKKPRSISQTYPCQPSNCPTYRTKNFQQSDWEGKTLKIRICKILSNCSTNFDRGHAKPCRLSRLPLPCKFDDMIADIFKADQSASKLSLITMSRKLRATLTDICRCINETLGKMSREEVKRCRFHCEISSGSVTFKLVQREPNGCKACLFSDRIVTDKISGQFTPRATQFSRKFENIEEEDIDKSDLSIFESTQDDLAHKDLRQVSSLPVETKSGTEPQIKNSINLSERQLDAINHQKSNEVVGTESSIKLSENHINDQSCTCISSFLTSFENPDRKEEGNTGTNRVEGSETTAGRNNSVESPEKATLVQSSENAVEDELCYCNHSDNNKLELFNRGPEKTQDTDYVDRIEVTETESLGKKVTPEASFNHLSGNEAEYQTCHCSDSFPYTFSINRDSEKNEEINSVQCVEKQVENIEPSNCEESCQDACSNIPNDQRTSNTNAEEIDPVIESIENVQPVITNQFGFSNSPPAMKSQNDMTNKIESDEIRGCECPDSCECINKCSDEDEVEKCDSQCSCDACKGLEKLKPFNPVSEDIRASQLVNPEQSSKVNLSISHFVEPIITERSQYFDTTGSVQFQPKSLKSESNSQDPHHPKNDQDTSTKSKISLPSTSSKLPYLGTKIEDTWLNHTSFKSVQTVTEELPSSVIRETKKTLSLARSPIRIDTGRASSSRSQRINISIELCSESESSGEKSLKKEPSTLLPVYQNGLIKYDVQDLPSMWKPRCHSADARISRKQAILKSEKNTKDECLRHLRGINACVHSPPRPLESRDYLPPSEPPPRMGNPIVYGMLTKCERQSMRQHKTRKNGLKYSQNNENSPCCNKFQKNGQIKKPDELPSQFPSATKKPKDVSSSAIHNNICHAFSASSVDRMKHLIKTRLRRILLERDKATNTPKTSLANKKYRVSVPNGKNKRLPFPRQHCHTIWESRSASASTRTSNTFGSNGQSLAKVSEGKEIKTLFDSTTNSKIVSSDHKDSEACQDSDKTTCYCLKSNNQSVVSSRIIDQRLVGGSNTPCQKAIDREFRYLWKQRQESVQKITSKEVRYVYNHSDDSFSLKSINHNFTGDLVARDTSSKPLRLCNVADCEKEVTFNERQDMITKCPGKLDWSGNSTSRHIYLYEYDNFESSNEEEGNKWCEPNTCLPKCSSLLICKKGRTKKDPRRTQRTKKKNPRQANSRSPRRQFSREPIKPRNIHASSFVSSKIRATSNIKSQKGFSKLDQDLRSKLLQYVRLCKNVKYSLLKMLRPDDAYVRRLSIPPTNRYKFGDS